MANIVVERAEGSLLDRLRQYQVLIDGVYRGSIGQKERWSFSVEPGMHSVVFRVLKTATPPIKVMVEDRTRLIVQPSLGAAFGVAGAAHPHVHILETSEPFAGEDSDPRHLAPRTAPEIEAPNRKQRGAPMHGAVLMSVAGAPATDEHRNWVGIDMKSALDGDAITPTYRPRMTLHDHRVSAVVAEAVWHHPKHGTLAAAEFVPLAAEFGLLAAIGQKMLRKIFEDVRTFPGKLPVVLSVDGFPLVANATIPLLVTALGEAGLPAGRLHLRVPETYLHATATEPRMVLRGLKAMGIRLIASQIRPIERTPDELRDLLLDGVELDASFADALLNEPDDEGVAHDLTSLFQAQGMEITGGGILTRDQLSALVRAGARELSGDLFGQTLSALEMRRLLLRANSDDKAADGRSIGFLKVVESLNEAVVVTDEEDAGSGHRIVYCNPAFYSMTGYSPPEILGKSPRLLQGQMTSDGAKEKARIAVANGSAAQVELINYTKGAAPFTCDLRLVPLASDEGAHSRYAGIMRDVTHHAFAETLALHAVDRDIETGLRNRRGLMRVLSAAIAGQAPIDDCRASGLAALLVVPPEQDADGSGGGQFSAAGRLFHFSRRADTVAYLGGGVFGVFVPVNSEGELSSYLSALTCHLRLSGLTVLAAASGIHAGSESASDLLDRVVAELH